MHSYGLDCDYYCGSDALKGYGARKCLVPVLQRSANDSEGQKCMIDGALMEVFHFLIFDRFLILERSFQIKNLGKGI